MLSTMEVLRILNNRYRCKKVVCSQFNTSRPKSVIDSKKCKCYYKEFSFLRAKNVNVIIKSFLS